ncbi:MAG: B-box zinc finger protein [Candidatus Jordarchaeaceae archaeon]
MIVSERFRCPFCREAEVAYYCEECKTSFCNTCAQEKKEEYLFCGSCGSKEINPEENKNSKRGCQSCGSIYIRTGIRKWKLCPNCNSSIVKTVTDKAIELKKAVVDSINSLIYGYELLKDFLRRLKEARSRLVFLRRRRFIHYPKMEEMLLSLFQEIVSIKRRIEARAQQVLNVVQAQLIDFSYTENWSPSLFPQIQTAVDRISADINEYKLYSKELLATPEKNLGAINSTIKLLNFHLNLFEEHREKINLEISEKPVAAIPGVKYTGSSFLSLESSTGILFFTDKRLIFLREKGMLKKSYLKHFDFPLKLFKIGKEGSIRKKVSFEGLQGDIKFSAPKNILEAIEKYAELAKNFDKNSIKDKDQITKLENIEVTLEDLKKELNKKIRSVFTPKVKEPAPELRPKPPVPNAANIAFQKPPERRVTYTSTFPNTSTAEWKKSEIAYWKSKKYSNEQLLKKVEELWHRAEISAEEYFKRIKSINEELYLINKKLDELGVQNEPVMKRAIE